MTLRRKVLTTVFALTVPVLLWGGAADGMIPSALEHYQKGIMLERMNDFRGAEQAYRMALALDPYDSLTYLRLAHLVEQNGKKDEALDLYQKALELNPRDTMIRLAIAQLWESKNQPAKALEQYNQIALENPSYAYVFLPKARIHKQLKQNNEAIQTYRQFLQAYPRHIDAQRELAALLLSEEQYDKAADIYQNLKSQDAQKFKDDLAYGIALNKADKSAEALEVFQNIQTPSVVLYQQTAIALEKLNRLGEAINAYRQAVDMAPAENNQLYLKIADLAMSLNQPQRAIEALQAYLHYHPENGKVAKSIADLLLQQKNFTAAASYYHDALNHLPETEKTFRSEAYRNLGYAYQMQDDLDKAAQSYELALGYSDDRQTRLNLALTYHKQGRYDRALELYRKLLVEDPDNRTLKKDVGQVLLALGDEAFKAGDFAAAMARYQDAFLLGETQEIPALLGIANAHFAKKDYDLAYSTYERILQKDPDNAIARLNKAQLDLERKNYMQALENLRWVVQHKPDSLEAYRLLAKTHEGLGDYGQAILNYQKALELQPQDSSLLLGYGNAWRHVGNLEKARQTYEMAKAASPDNAMVRYNLGSIYNMQNQLEASLEEYRAALKLNPQFAEPYYGMGTTLEKQKKLDEALEVYQQFVEKAPPTSAYLPLARERIEFLKKTVQPDAKTEPPTTSASPMPSATTGEKP